MHARTIEPALTRNNAAGSGAAVAVVKFTLSIAKSHPSVFAEAMDTAQRGMGMDWRASLELIRLRNGEVVWGAVILVGLCLLLILLGWIEERSGLENLRLPDEIWRVDRLPGAEG